MKGVSLAAIIALGVSACGPSATDTKAIAVDTTLTAPATVPAAESGVALNDTAVSEAETSLESEEGGGPSFDCAKALTAVEGAICADAGIAAKDRDVANRYRGWLAAIEAGRLIDDASEIAADQRAWIGRRNACVDAACISNAYDERLAELPEAS